MKLKNNIARFLMKSEREKNSQIKSPSAIFNGGKKRQTETEHIRQKEDE